MQNKFPANKAPKYVRTSKRRYSLDRNERIDQLHGYFGAVPRESTLHSTRPVNSPFCSDDGSISFRLDERDEKKRATSIVYPRNVRDRDVTSGGKIFLFPLVPLYQRRTKQNGRQNYSESMVVAPNRRRPV